MWEDERRGDKEGLEDGEKGRGEARAEMRRGRKKGREEGEWGERKRSGEREERG